MARRWRPGLFVSRDIGSLRRATGGGPLCAAAAVRPKGASEAAAPQRRDSLQPGGV